MPESKSHLLFKEQLDNLIGIVVSHANEDIRVINAGYGSTMVQTARICECCGSSFVGYRTFNSIYAPKIVPEKQVADWNTKQIIVTGFLKPDELPELQTGRMFLRLKGSRKDFMLTWENT